MSGIRALTLLLENPSAAATALRDVLGWQIEADFGSFASLTAPGSIPLWVNAPGDGEEPSRGAVAVREPTDMDFGERSACVRIAAAPGVTVDFSRPVG